MKWNKVHFDTLESTNKTAVNYPVYSVISADTQTAGRGRYGRFWNSPIGNLYMSIVLPDRVDQTPYMAFVVAVAVAKALKSFPIQIKWPNDILLDGQKLAGILLEKIDDKLIIGIGVNVVSCPSENLSYAATHLNGVVTKEEVLERILSAFDETLDLLNEQGFSAVRHIWKSYAVGLGKSIRVNLPSVTLNGIFKDLSESGALLLEQPDKTIKEITAGVVFLLDD